MATQTQSKKIKATAQRAPKKNSVTPITSKKLAKIDPQNLEAIRFLESMDNATPEEIEEQKETWAFLKKALDEDRLSPNRPHFPDEDDNSL